MAVFTKESHNHFDVDTFGDVNDGFSFGFRISVDGDYFTVSGMSMAELLDINKAIARAIGGVRRQLRGVRA